MADYKILPNSLEAEQALLGCILFDNEIQRDILADVQPEDFYSEAHKKIYESMQKIYMKNIPVDFVTLTSQLEVEKKLEAVGGIEYISFLTDSVPSAANFQHYLDIVKDASVRRHLIFTSQKIINNTFDSENGEGAMRFAEKEIFNLSQKGMKTDLEAVGVPGGAMTNLLKQMSFLSENKGKLRGIETGYKDFDEITNGLQNSDLIILAARPGVGKTSFAMNIAVHAATTAGKKVAVFSLEMAREQLMARSLSSLSKVELKKILNGDLTPEEWKRAWTAEKKLSSSGIYIDPTAGISPFEVRTKCQKLKLTDGLDLVVIDYLTLMNLNSASDKQRGYRAENKNQEITQITKALKQMAKELNVPVILLAQLNRGPDLREDHRPMIADLRESGSIEQDADIVLFLYNPAKYNAEKPEDDPGTVYLNIAKHRNGETGEIKLKWVGEYTTYFNYGEKIKSEIVEE